MKKLLFICLLFILISLPGRGSEGHLLFPDQGVLDLRNTQLNEQSYLNLNGEWRFHWQKLIDPSTRLDVFEQDPGLLVHVPSYWKSYTLDGQPLPGMGYGTYSLTILLPEDYRSTLCFDIPIFDVAYTFYLNERLVDTNGQVGSSREEEEPWYEPSSFCYVPDSDTLHLLIQVSNFHHRRGGFWKSIYTGGSEKVLGKMEHRRMYNYSTIGILFFFFFFYLIFWFFSKWNRMMLLFALTVFGILIRTVNTGLYFSNSFVEAPWTWQIRMEYLGSYVAFVFGMLFLNQIFPAKYMKPFIRANTIFFTLAAVSLFLLPVHIFSYEMLVFQPAIFLFLVYYLIRSLIGTLRGKVMDAIFFISLGLFMYTLVNDILLANTAGAIHNTYLSQLSFQIFIFAMAVVIIIQWVNNYNTRLQLESSLRFKNKVLSVIAHDLKNPVASVAQFSELLANKPDLAKKEHIVNSLKESSQAAVTLLDNLLYWGRSESDELIVEPISLSVDEVIRDVESLYLHMLMQKEIKFTADLPQGIQIYADKTLMNIVVRNLVSNAIKFTPRHGSIRVQVVDEGAQVRFEISDSGVGISTELLDQYEKNGIMGSSAGTNQEVGTGLGLQLVQDLVQRSGGSLTIKSKPDQGSVFTFTIPSPNTREE
jgi:signal transduction histidine kinase